MDGGEVWRPKQLHYGLESSSGMNIIIRLTFLYFACKILYMSNVKEKFITNFNFGLNNFLVLVIWIFWVLVSVKKNKIGFDPWNIENFVYGPLLFFVYALKYLSILKLVPIILYRIDVVFTK